MLSRSTAACIGVALAGCPRGAPPAHAPSGPHVVEDPGVPADPAAGPEDAATRRVAELSLVASVASPTHIGVAEPLDLEIPDPDGLDVARNGVHGACDSGRSPDGGIRCVLLQVSTSERVTLSSSTAREVVVEARRPPPATLLRVGGTTRLRPLPGRGGWAGQFTLREPADVHLTWSAAHDGPSHRGLHQPQLDVLGPGGVRSAHVHHTYTPPDRNGAVWALPAGTWTVRGSELDAMRFACSGAEGLPPPPAWCEPAPDAEPYPVDVTLEVEAPEGGAAADDTAPGAPGVTLAAGTHTLTVNARPEPVEHRVDAPIGQDLVLRWSPADRALLYHWRLPGPDGDAWARGVCTRWPCVFPAVRFDAITLSVPNVEVPAEAVQVEVLSVAPPAPAGPMAPGHVLTTTLDHMPDDLRGAYVDVALEFAAPGDYRLGVLVEPGEAIPDIELLPGAWSESLLNLMGGAREYHAIVVEVDAPGTFVARISAQTDAAPQRIQFELQEQ